MYVYDFYLIYDKRKYEKMLEFGDVLLDRDVSIIGEPILSLEREKKMNDIELKELKEMIEEMVEEQYDIGKDSMIVYEVWEV